MLSAIEAEQGRRGAVGVTNANARPAQAERHERADSAAP